MALSTLTSLLGRLDYRRTGLLIAALLACGLLLSQLVSGDIGRLVVTAVFSVLVILGLLALAGLSSGLLKVVGDQHSASGNLTLLDELPEGVLVTDGQKNVLFANAAYLNIAGNETKVAPTIEQLFVGEVAAAEPIYRLTQAIKNGKNWQEEFRVSNMNAGSERLQGTPSWYRISVAPHGSWHTGPGATDSMHDNKDELARSGSRCQDGSVTIWQIAEISSERHRQEESFGKLQEIIDYLDQAPAGFFSADDKGRIDYLNATLAGWLGLDLADAVSSQLLLKDIVSGDGATLLAQKSLAQKIDSDKLTFDLDLIRQDGTLLPVRLLHQMVFDGGCANQSRTLVLNRAPGAESGEDLRAAEVRFARFFHSAPIAIATLDKRGVVGSTNAAFARMFTKSMHDESSPDTAEEGVDIISLVVEENKEEVSLALDRASSGQVKISPLNVSFSGDTEQTGRLYLSPAGSIDRETDSKFGGAILYAIDTTDQKSMERQMVQGQKMQAVGQLAGGIAHDFNNVLTAIILGTDELLGSARATDPGFKDIISIKQNANRAASLVRQILAFSRRQTLRPEVLNLNDVVSNLSILLDRLLSDNVKLNMERYRDLWLVRADVIQFEQVIVNLAVNARDAMPAGGVVTIATRNITQRMSADLEDQGMQVGEYVLIEVSDTGSGMTKEVSDKVFEPFFTTKGVGKGTGLGLSMVYGIVKQTGGFIYIDSTVSEGTTFRIYLPRQEEDLEEMAHRQLQEKQKDKKNKPDLTGTESILLVEDEEAVRGFSARALRKRGYEVFEAGTGVQALKVMDELEGRIDLVVTDVMMPEMDGPTMAKEMRNENPELKIIFVSGFAREILDEADDFIFMAKPYGLKDLAAKVKEVLAD
ncbi:MAG: response regulator [bacterium]|nr:response regulator [bacterium]